MQATHTQATHAFAGSGKTSLVNALAGRLEGGALQGSILVNGRDRAKNFKNISGRVALSPPAARLAAVAHVC